MPVLSQFVLVRRHNDVRIWVERPSLPPRRLERLSSTAHPSPTARTSPGLGRRGERPTMSVNTGSPTRWVPGWLRAALHVVVSVFGRTSGADCGTIQPGRPRRWGHSLRGRGRSLFTTLTRRPRQRRTAACSPPVASARAVRMPTAARRPPSPPRAAEGGGRLTLPLPPRLLACAVPVLDPLLWPSVAPGTGHLLRRHDSLWPSRPLHPTLFAPPGPLGQERIAVAALALWLPASENPLHQHHAYGRSPLDTGTAAVVALALFVLTAGPGTPVHAARLPALARPSAPGPRAPLHHTPARAQWGWRDGFNERPLPASIADTDGIFLLGPSRAISHLPRTARGDLALPGVPARSAAPLTVLLAPPLATAPGSIMSKPTAVLRHYDRAHASRWASGSRRTWLQPVQSASGLSLPQLDLPRPAGRPYPEATLSLDARRRKGWQPLLRARASRLPGNAHATRTRGQDDQPHTVVSRHRSPGAPVR